MRDASTIIGEFASGAVDHASRTDDLVDQANTELELARVLTAIARPEVAIQEARDALDLFLTKHYHPGAERDAPCSISSGPTSSP